MASDPDPRVDRYIDAPLAARLNAPALRPMFEQIVADDRAGAWRRIKQGA
jgi:hypothetical protein